VCFAATPRQDVAGTGIRLDGFDLCQLPRGQSFLSRWSNV
jgi:hypothetical protein